MFNKKLTFIVLVILSALMFNSYSLSSINTNSFDLHSKFIKLSERFPNYIKIEDLGFSMDKRPLYAVIVTSGIQEQYGRIDFKVRKKHILFESGAHARERLNPILMYDLLEDFMVNGDKGILNESALHIIPLVNPDGYDLVLGGNIRDTNLLEEFSKFNGDKSRLKANIRGVDLNRNYPSFVKIKGETINLFKNNYTKYPSDKHGLENYAGDDFLTEETKLVADYILKYDFRFVVSWHSRGEVLYWDNYYFNGNHRERSYALGLKVKSLNGYQMWGKHEGDGYGSIGNFVRAYTDKPTLTIETQIGSFPVTQSYLERAFNQNKGIIPLLLEDNYYLDYKLYSNGIYVNDYSDYKSAEFGAELLGLDNYKIVTYKGKPNILSVTKELLNFETYQG
jgi:g-D-glutamyl-meso-diaminopimelate peptidase